MLGPWPLFALCAAAGLAGLVDAVAGGGGLIQLPALFLWLPPPETAAVAAVLGTNKLSSICGTGMAAVQYARRIPLHRPLLLPAAGAALAGAFLGARAVAWVNPAVLRPLIWGLLVLVTVYTVARKRLGEHHTPRFNARQERVWGALVGAGIGLYDGFFGPGTGSFLLFTLVSLFGFDFLVASASAKVINFATNLAALGTFAAGGQVLYRYGVPMAVCNVLGGWLGARLALGRGNRLVRAVFLTVTTALIVRFGWEVLGR